MPESSNHVLALQIVDCQRFIERFGQWMSAAVWDEVVVAFYQIAQKVLSRHHIFSPVIAPSWGRCIIFFKFDVSAFVFDLDEQIDAISNAAGHMARQMLQEHLGKATGRQLNFKIAVTAVRKNVDDIQGLNMRLDSLFSNLPNCSAPFSSVNRQYVQRILNNEEIETYFQPIFSTDTEMIVGYEALSRGPKNTVLYDADMLFGTAAYWGLTETLELLCIKQALSWMEKIPDTYWVALNVGPALLKTAAFSDLVFQERLKTHWPRLIFELTEHLPLDAFQDLRSAIDTLKSRSISVSLDDTGCGFADFQTSEVLKPKIIKLCITITRQIRKEADALKAFNDAVAKLLRNSEVVLGEGVEQQAQLELLKTCGVSMAQGFYFERPRPAAEIF